MTAAPENSGTAARTALDLETIRHSSLYNDDLAPVSPARRN